MRSAGVPDRLGITSMPGGSQGPTSPLRRRTCRSARAAAMAVSVSCRHASARLAASAGVKGGVSRGLDLAGDG
jgi:hypothetical protein